MKVVVQRVSCSAVKVDGVTVSSAGRGILLLVAFSEGDATEDLAWMAKKCLELRIFEDEEGKMNLSLLDVEGEVMVVSQFTLYGDCRKGRRPDYTRSAASARANILYREFISILEGIYPRVSEGVFGAHMTVELVNDGPVTLIIERD